MQREGFVVYLCVVSVPVSKLIAAVVGWHELPGLNRCVDPAFHLACC